MEGGVDVVNISEPTEPQLIYNIPLSGSSRNTTIYDGNIFVAHRIAMSIISFPSYSTYDYLPGDVNMFTNEWPPVVSGSDVTYLANYFMQVETSIPCLLGGFWSSADINGDCQIIGSDVTRLVNYFRYETEINYCPNRMPSWYSFNDLPGYEPEGWAGCD
jgi:hypothetical protein